MTATTAREEVRIEGNVPGALGRLVELHGTYYSREWGLGPQFEIKIAAEMAAFLAGLDPVRDGFWTATTGGRVVGAVAIDGRGSSPDRPTGGAPAGSARAVRLRCFIVDPAYAGRGVGRRLMESAMAFCRERGFPAVELWTYAGLDAARHLYEAFGFRLREEYTDEAWGRAVRHQRFVWRPAPDEVVIRSFQPGDEEAFRRLNEEWIERHFRLEEGDRKALSDPARHFITPGGQILMAVLEGEPVGCCALLPLGEGCFEVAKMGVTTACQGRGVGRRLLTEAIETARRTGARRLYLETNRTLTPAIRLYESCGFRHLPPDRVTPSPYARADVYMEMWLGGEAVNLRAEGEPG